MSGITWFSCEITLPYLKMCRQFGFQGPPHSVGSLQPDTQGGCWELCQMEISKLIYVLIFLL